MQLWDDCPLAPAVRELYENNNQAAAVVDGALLIVWANEGARALYPFFRMPDGIRGLLDAASAQRLQAAVEAGEACSVDLSAPLPGEAMLFLSPLQAGEERFALCLIRAGDRASDAARTLAVFSSQTRSPLRNIFDSLAALAQREDVTKESGLLAPLQNIRQNGYRIMRHCNNQMEFARYTAAVDPICPQAMDLGVLVAELCKAARVLLRDTGVELTYAVPDFPFICACDAGRLQIAILNLLSNARRFTREGNAIHVALESLGTRARLTVADRGRGIAPEVLPRVFEPFFTADSSAFETTGGGLGLTVAKLCVEAHGGSIAIRSTPGVGTTVALTLPAAANPGELLMRAPRMARIMCDRYSHLYVFLSDVCKCPWP